MRTIGSYEAKTHLPDILKRVEQGEEILITRRGVPVAKLIPAKTPSKKEIKKAIAEIERLSEDCTLGGIEIQDMIHEGHKY